MPASTPCASQFEVNALGPLRVDAGLLDHLGAGAKIAIITSRMGSIADNDSGGYYGYRASKAAVNAIGKSLAIDLGPGASRYTCCIQATWRPTWSAAAATSPRRRRRKHWSREWMRSARQSGSFWHSNGSHVALVTYCRSGAGCDPTVRFAAVAALNEQRPPEHAMAISVVRVSALLLAFAVVPAGVCNAQALPGTASGRLTALFDSRRPATAC